MLITFLNNDLFILFSLQNGCSHNCISNCNAVFCSIYCLVSTSLCKIQFVHSDNRIFKLTHIWVKSLVMDICVETLEDGELVKDFKQFELYEIRLQTGP
jgi:hypothetical protein